jgi:hypothetical protein
LRAVPANAWFFNTSTNWKYLACCAHQRLLFQHIHIFLYNILFSSLDLFARTILVASFSLKGSSYCNHSHPSHQVKMTCPTWSLPYG